MTFPGCTVDGGGGGGGLVTASSTGLRFLFGPPASEAEDSMVPVGSYIPAVMLGKLIEV